MAEQHSGNWNEATDRLNRWLTGDDETALQLAAVASAELEVARQLDSESAEDRATRRLAEHIRTMCESTYLSADFLEVARAFVRGAA